MDNEKFIIKYIDNHREIVNTGRTRLRRPKILRWPFKYRGFMKKEWHDASELLHSIPDD